MTRRVETGKYSEWINKHLDVKSTSGPEVMAMCQFHEAGHATMQVNVDSGLFTCFSCSAGGSISKLAEQMGIFDFKQVAPDLADIRKKLRNLDEKDEPEARYKEEFLDRYKFPTDYWTGRGFTEQTIETFDLGYDLVGNYVTIPVRNMYGELLGVTKRFLEGESRYIYPSTFKKSRHMFGDWLVNESHDDLVVITEGAVDAMKCWQAGFQGLALYGSTLSTAQIRVLRRLGVGRVILFADNDPSGERAAERCLGYVAHKRKFRTIREYHPELDLRREFLVSQVEYFEGMEDDPGAMDDTQICDAVDEAVRVP